MLSKNKIVSFALLVLLALNNISVLAEKIDIQAVQTENCKYPDYATMYVGEDKYEKFNRKMFGFKLAIIINWMQVFSGVKFNIFVFT